MTEPAQLQLELDTDLPAEPPDAAGEELADNEARNAIHHHLQETLFVEAGAGSGKTTSLVRRIVGLITNPHDPIPLADIAAITFTEKAAAELRDRIRGELEAVQADERSSVGDQQRCALALDDLDGAAISTLHAFAQRLLSEQAVEARLPPSVDVLDEISSQVAFDNRWDRFVDDLLDQSDHERSILIADAVGARLDHLRDIARAFAQNWDLIEERVDPDTPPPGSVDVGPVIDAMAPLLDARDECLDADDKMLERLDVLEPWVRQLEDQTSDLAALRVLARPPATFKAGNKGRAGVWPGRPLKELRAELADVEMTVAEVRQTIGEAALKHLAVAIRRFTLDEAAERRRTGHLEFHDLLVLARGLLRDPDRGPGARTVLRGRYRRLLLDEFQDTDPIQIELAVLLADMADDAHERAWEDLRPEPGRLFFVGDPKQSIYRFRRADIGLFLRAREAFTDTPTTLFQNFRTTKPIIEWINAVFGELISPVEDSQPDYQPLAARREPPERGPAVTLLAHEPDEGADINAATLRELEANDVVNAITTALVDEWQVEDDEAHDESAGTGWRPAALGDITILLPARTSLPFLERALTDAQIPYRAETSSLVYSTAEVRDLFAAVRAIDDATDELFLITALRSPLFGCGDDDLYRFKVEHDGRWDHQHPLPDSLAADDPVGEALTYLGQLHRDRLWMTPSELLERIVRDRRMLELGFAGRRPRDLWRRVRFVVDQARAYTEAEGGGLRDYLLWAERQSSDGARVSETVLPETDDDSVRIMTIHGAKGLEFPICILSGMTTELQRRQSGVQVVFPSGGGYGLKINASMSTKEFDRFQPLDEQLDLHERLRLLYVACTRARDHLVISTRRKFRRSGEAKTMAEVLWAASESCPDLVDALDSPGDRRIESTAPDPLPAIDPTTWSDDREAALGRSALSSTVAATTLAAEYQAALSDADSADGAAAGGVAPDPALQKDGRDLELPPWNKGRYGTAIGRAVHAVLQTVDLATGERLEETAAAQAAAEGVVGRESTIVDLARSAIESDVVRTAVRHTHWRETYVVAPIGERSIEGYVDLLYRTDEGLVVVDYKTDAADDDAELDAKLARYALQGAAYAVALEEAVGETVHACVFLFLSRSTAVRRDVVDLDDAKRTIVDQMLRPAQ